jgi:hypothetical protein
MCRIQMNEEHLTMDTNPIAKPFSAAAADWRAIIAMDRGPLHAARIALAAAALLPSAGLAAAQVRYPVAAGRSYGLYDAGRQTLDPARSDRIHFDHSGARGRDGLGGSPFHPEGPGNDSD